MENHVLYGRWLQKGLYLRQTLNKIHLSTRIVYIPCFQISLHDDWSPLICAKCYHIPRDLVGDVMTLNKDWIFQRHADVWRHPDSFRYIQPPHPGYPKVTMMVMKDRLTFLSFHANQPSYSWNKAISNFNLEISRPRPWAWSNGKIIQSAQYLTDLFSFCFTSVR